MYSADKWIGDILHGAYNAAFLWRKAAKKTAKLSDFICGDMCI